MTGYHVKFVLLVFAVCKKTWLVTSARPSVVFLMLSKDSNFLSRLKKPRFWNSDLSLFLGEVAELPRLSIFGYFLSYFVMLE